MVWRGGLQDIFYWRGLIFDRRSGGGIISKKTEAWLERGGEKI